LDLSKSTDLTLRGRELNVWRKSTVLSGKDWVFVRVRLRREDSIGLPDEVIGRPLLTKTLDAAEGGRSFFLFGFGVNVGRDRDSDCAVAGRLGFCGRREEDLRWMELLVLDERLFNGGGKLKKKGSPGRG
jgi:hypothetical protein